MRSASVVCRVLSVALLAGLSAVAQVNPVPLVNQALVPVSVAPGSTTFTLTVNGTGFASTATVNWNGASRLTEVISSSQLKATIRASDVATAKTASITVTNPAPGGGVSNVVFFPVTQPSAAIGMAISQAFPNAVNVVVGDFNNDGKLDVAWEDNNHVVMLSLGDGKGGFQAPIPGVTANISYQMLTGDFNGDGKLDIVGTDGGGEIYVLLGNGDGTFTKSWTYLAKGGGNYIALGDFNRDGHLDLYVTGWDTGRQWFDILPGLGDGTFNSLVGDYMVSYFAGPAAVGDFNGDGYLDLAISESTGGVDVFLGNELGGFVELGSSPVGWYPLAVDVNADGILDLMTGSACVFPGSGTGTFTVGGCPTFEGAGVAGFGDFNGDGKLDAIVMENPDSSIVVHIQVGAGDGTFSSLASFVAGTRVGSDSGAVGDFNNDGKLDVVSPNGYVLLQTTVDLTPLSLAFGARSPGTTSPAQTATLTNVGSSALVINQIRISGTDSTSFAEANDCGSSLAANTSCTISVRFAPTKTGPLSASLDVSYKGTASPQTVVLSGTGLAAPKVSLTPSSLQYGILLVGSTSAAQTATLTNTGDHSVSISDISITGEFAQTNNCPTLLRAHQMCQMQVTFSPTLAGAASGTLSVTDNAKGSPQQVTLSGTGTVITLSPISINFGNQKVGTKSATAPITVSNIGATAVSLGQIAISGTNAGDFSQTNNCGTSLAGLGSCTINVTFRPAATGARSAAVTINDSGGGSPQSVALTGTGT